jgi:NTP pyrophosphatase (non-canonical NTP hydrolase)
MNIPEIAITKIIDELKKAEKKFPGFPSDIVHCSAILSEEAGEVAQAALDFYYGRSDNSDKLIKELTHAGAMAIRFLIRVLDFSHYPEQERK